MYLVASFQVNIALPCQDLDTAPTDISYFDVTEHRDRDLADIAHDPLVLFSVPTIA